MPPIRKEGTNEKHKQPNEQLFQKRKRDEKTAPQKRKRETKPVKEKKTETISSQKSSKKRLTPVKLDTTKVKKKTVKEQDWLGEVRVLQQLHGFFIPKTTFRRVVNDTVSELVADETYFANKNSILENGKVRFDTMSLEALQTATEHYLTELFMASNIETIHAGRSTLMLNDMIVAQRASTFNIKDWETTKTKKERYLYMEDTTNGED